MKYQITGGTGRFEGASGELTMTATQMAVLRNAAGMPALLMFTGEFEGTIARVSQSRKGGTAGSEVIARSTRKEGQRIGRRFIRLWRTCWPR